MRGIEKGQNGCTEDVNGGEVPVSHSTRTREEIFLRKPDPILEGLSQRKGIRPVVSTASEVKCRLNLRKNCLLEKYLSDYVSYNASIQGVRVGVEGGKRFHWKIHLEIWVNQR